MAGEDKNDDGPFSRAVGQQNIANRNWVAYFGALTLAFLLAPYHSGERRGWQAGVKAGNAGRQRYCYCATLKRCDRSFHFVSI